MVATSGTWYYQDITATASTTDTITYNVPASGSGDFSFTVNIHWADISQDWYNECKRIIKDFLENKFRINLLRKSLFSKIIKPKLVTKKNVTIQIHIPASRNFRCKESMRR